MKPINANTKISHLIKAHPEALDAITEIDPKFRKLRNPLLRKAFAGRTSIGMASKIAGCKVDDFFAKLKPLGFEVEATSAPEPTEKKKLPAFMTALKKDQIVDLDVRELLTEGKDPLSLILGKVKSVQAGEALKVINTFEPVPLIKILEKQGFDTYADVINDDLVETYFYKKSDQEGIDLDPKNQANDGWEEQLQRFGDNLRTVDVRELEMPLPMHTILGELDELPADKALYVYHKRIPVFLLPELGDRNFDYRIKEIGDGEVHLLIFAN